MMTEKKLAPEMAVIMRVKTNVFASCFILLGNI